MTDVQTDVQTDVLVVGAGPAGGTAALALASYGVAVVCISKYRATSPTPRAHIMNQRAMEILRHFGLEQQAMALATPQKFMRDNVFCTSLTGREFGRIEAWSTQPLLQAQHDLASPCKMSDLTQEMLEPIILTEAERRGAHVRFETELIDFTQDGEGVTAHVRDRLTGHEYDIRARYLIGADGGNSLVAQLAGWPLEGRTKFAASLGIGFRADLRNYVEHRPGDMYWMIQPGHGIMGFGIGGLRLVREWDRWIVTWGYDPNEPPPQPSDAEAIAIVHRILGDDTIPVELETTTYWTMNQIHATTIRTGRVFGMGDAVHRHPPMGGLGSNIALQDAYNLAWKLAFVLRGDAGEGLLDSYEAERGPVAEEVVHRSMRNLGKVYGRVAAALGLTRQAQDQTEMDELVDQFTEPTAAGMARRRDVRNAIAGCVYGFSAVGGEFNLHYVSDAIVPDGLDLRVDDPELEVILGLQSGRRLPHAWLTERQHRVSSLDLCGDGFTLLTGPAGQAWGAAAEQAAKLLGVAVTVQVVGPGRRYEDPYGEFARLCLPDETGAILVRPDHVVAWRADSMPDQAAVALHAALSAVLSRPPGHSAGASPDLTAPEAVPVS